MAKWGRYSLGCGLLGVEEDHLLGRNIRDADAIFGSGFAPWVGEDRDSLERVRKHVEDAGDGGALEGVLFSVARLDDLSGGERRWHEPCGSGEG